MQHKPHRRDHPEHGLSYCPVSLSPVSIQYGRIDRHSQKSQIVNGDIPYHRKNDIVSRSVYHTGAKHDRPEEQHIRRDHDFLRIHSDPGIIHKTDTHHEQQTDDQKKQRSRSKPAVTARLDHFRLDQFLEHITDDTQRSDQRDHAPRHLRTVDPVHFISRLYGISHLPHRCFLGLLLFHPLAEVGSLLILDMSQQFIPDRLSCHLTADLIRQCLQIFFRFHTTPPAVSTLVTACA